MMYQDIYNCICENTKNYVKPTAQLLFKNRFPKGGPTCRRQVVNSRHQTSQGQMLYLTNSYVFIVSEYVYNSACNLLSKLPVLCHVMSVVF